MRWGNRAQHAIAPNQNVTYLRDNEKGALHVDHGKPITELTKKQSCPSQQTSAKHEKKRITNDKMVRPRKVDYHQQERAAQDLVSLQRHAAWSYLASFLGTIP